MPENDPHDIQPAEENKHSAASLDQVLDQLVAEEDELFSTEQPEQPADPSPPAADIPVNDPLLPPEQPQPEDHVWAEINSQLPTADQAASQQPAIPEAPELPDPATLLDPELVARPAVSEPEPEFFDPKNQPPAAEVSDSPPAPVFNTQQPESAADPLTAPALPDQQPEPAVNSEAETIIDPQDLAALAANQELPPEIAAELGLSTAADDDGIHVAARRANLGGSNHLPIDIRDPKDGVNEINLPLGAFSDLEYGQTGVLSLSVRNLPGFKEQARAWVRARKAGHDPELELSWYQKIWAAVKYAYVWLNIEIQTGGGAEKPTPPWRRGQDLTPIPASQVDENEKQAWKDVNAKAASKAHYEVVMRAMVIGNEEQADLSEGIVDEFCISAEAFNTIHQEIFWEPGHPEDSLLGNMSAHPPQQVGMVLSDKELSVLAHPFDDTVSPHNVKVARSSFKQLPLASPIYIEDPYSPPPGVIPIGLMNAQSEDEMAIGMNNSELDKHMIVVGKTGSGKTEWLKWAVHGIAKANYPMVLIDPHGQLAEEMFNSLLINSPERHDDIVFVDLSDDRFPVAMNPLDVGSLSQVDGAVGAVVEMLASPTVNLGKGGAPRAIGYAQEALIALCHANMRLQDPQNKCTLLDVLSFFQDPEFRKVVVDVCENSTIRQRYDTDNGPFELMGEKAQVEHTSPVTRAFNDLGRSSAFQAVFSSPRNKLNFAELIKNNSLVIIQLSRFGSGQAELGAFVGSLVLPWLLSSMTVWGRSKDPLTGEVSGRGCRVLVDEAPTLMGAGSSVPQVLAEARKWDLGLVMAAQFLDQFDASIIDAALVNTNSKISLVQDPNKAGPITKAIAGASTRIKPEDVATLPNFHFYGNILLPTETGASASGPFSAACLPMINDDLQPEHLRVREQIIARSRQLVTNSLEDISALNQNRLANIKSALVTWIREEGQKGAPIPEALITGENSPFTSGPSERQ